MNLLPCPQGCTRSEFDEVKVQLNSEFTCVQSINTLFSYYDQFHVDLFSNSQALLTDIITGLNLQQGKNSKVATGAIASLFEGITYSALSYAPGLGPLIANIIQTGVNIGVSYANSGAHNAINPDPFQVSVFDLWNYLSTNFTNLYTITGQMQTQLLSDWGMLQAAYECTTILSGPKSLAWTPSTGPAALQSCKIGFSTAVIQYLMPINYQIAQHIFFVASNQQSTIYPTDSFMRDYIWGNYVNSDDFYISRNLWNFPTSLAAARSWRSGAPTIANNTSVPMKVTITLGKDSYTESLNTNSSFIYIYDDVSSANNLPKLDSGDQPNLKVTEEISGNTVATFSYMIESIAPIEGYIIKLLSSKIYTGYKFGETIVNDANFSDGYSATILSSIYIDQ